MGVGALLTLGGGTARGKSCGYLTPGEVRDEEEVAAVEARPPRALLHAVRAAPQGSAPTAGGSDPNACSGGAATISPTCVCVCAELQGAEPAVNTPSHALAPYLCWQPCSRTGAQPSHPELCQHHAGYYTPALLT